MGIRSSIYPHRWQTRRARFGVESLEDRRMLAGDLELLKDVNIDRLGEPVGLVAFQDRGYFWGNDRDLGYQLHVTDGTIPGTSIVEANLPTESRLIGPTVFDNSLFFVSVGSDGRATLWRTDGTIETTRQVADLGIGTIGRQAMHVVDNAFILHAGSKLWRSDGTFLGTIALSDDFADFAVHDDTVFFADSGKLWKTDSTGQRFLLKGNDVNSQPLPRELTMRSDGVVFFTATDLATGRELWKSDGTVLGTVRVANVDGEFTSSNPQQLTMIGDELFFTAIGATGQQVWKSDGTGEGTVPLTNISTTDSSLSRSHIRILTSTDETVLFTVNIGAYDELWTTDGTPDGTGKFFQLPGHIARANVAGNVITFITSNTNQLWTSDGTTAGTRVMSTLPGGVAVNSLASDGNAIFFTVAGDTDPWFSDGTTMGTIRLDLDLGSIITHSIPWMPAPKVHNQSLFFIANKNELWVSDGTAANTHFIKKFNDFPGPRFDWIANSVGEHFVFVADRRIWTSDGTATGTEMLADVEDTHSPVVVGDVLYFLQGRTNVTVWKSDGTPTGTTSFAEFVISNADRPPTATSLYSANDQLYLLNQGDVDRLYQTDGTVAGTELIQTADDISFIGAAGGNAAFSTWMEGDNWKLWATDGTKFGTQLLKSFTSYARIQNATIVGDLLYFTADDGSSGREIWTSDGTPQGTQIVKDIMPGFRSSEPDFLTNVDGTLYFMARDRYRGETLWKSDGTDSGTVIVADIDVDVFNLTNVGGTLHFVVVDDRRTELWKTDGTSLGTVVSQRFPIYGEAGPFIVVDFNGRAVVPQWTLAYGVEIWISRDGIDSEADVNGDGLVDAADVDELVRAVRAKLGDLRFDIDNNTIVDTRDVLYLLDTVLCTFPADANLDGKVDSLDLNEVGQHWLSSGSWQSGDFDGSGIVDAADLNILGIHWGQGTDTNNERRARQPRAPLPSRVVRLSTAFVDLAVIHSDQTLDAKSVPSDWRPKQTDLAFRDLAAPNAYLPRQTSNRPPSAKPAQSDESPRTAGQWPKPLASVRPKQLFGKG